MNRIQSVIAAIGVSLCATATAAGSFEVTSADKDLQALVTRWAQSEGKKVVWEAKGNAAIQDAGALNSGAQMHKATTFTQAVDRLNRSLEAARADNPNKPPALVACVFSDAIVIRTIAQPPCGSPL